MLNSEIQIKVPYFDGPLSLLLLLIQKEEMDVRRFDISVITDQYLSYLQRLQELNFDIAGDFLYMAATLLFLKSESCILDENRKSQIKDDDHPLSITSKSDLIRRLEELGRFQKLGEKLWALPKKGHETFIRPKCDRKNFMNSILLPMDKERLVLSMADLLHRESRKFAIINKDKISIKQKLMFFKSFFKVGQKTNLEEIISKDQKDKNLLENLIVSFISLLELSRLGKIRIFQPEYLKNIYLKMSLKT